MNWIQHAENRFGHLAIPGLVRFVAGLNLLVYVLYKLNPEFLGFLVLDPALVLQGQVWRLVSFVFVPSFGNFPLPEWFSVVLYLLCLVFFGDRLEEEMGAFRLNLYYLLGIVGVAIGGFIAGSGMFGNSVLNTGLLFAVAWYLPDLMIYLFYILPVKIKWVAWFTAAMLMYNFLGGSWAFRLSLITMLANYLIFFGADIIRDARHRQDVASRRGRFRKELQEDMPPSMHECKVCGRTEDSAPELEFRVARDGEEYCLEHLPPVAGK